MLEALRSAVNTWECDQMGHLNVRHYFARATQGWAVLGHALGLGPSALRERGLALHAVDQHVRFHHELRPGVPFTLCAGVLRASAERLHVYEELRSVANGRVSATFVSELRLERAAAPDAPVPFDPSVLERAATLQVTPPELAQPRGLDLDTPAPAQPRRDDPLAQRMVGAFLGPVLPEDCDEDGRMREAMFMARVSDGIAHLFRRVRDGLRPDGIGGAALEYRFVYRARPRAGTLVEVRSALTGLGRKTLHFGHLFFDVETGEAFASSEAVAVSFDLATRKSVEISDEARAFMQPQVVTGFRV
jgi:acyl-CoA thioester hydrolase